MAVALGGRLHGDDMRVRRVVVDSREAGPGDLFFALAGTRTHGHTFLEDAFHRGASAAVVEDASLAAWPIIEVPDTAAALLAMAAHERRASGARVVGITGSSGKTITKDLARAALSTTYRVHASPRSFNNQVGLPLTILGAGPGTDVLVCEIGAGVLGEISRLCEVARPDMGIVTNVGLAHVETFGSPRRIRRAKAELVEALPARGLAILNADDRVVRRYASRTVAGLLTYGRSIGAMVRAEDVVVGPDGRASFTLVAQGSRVRVELQAPGEHLVANALAAAACATGMGVPATTCAEAFRHAELSPWRMEVATRPDGVVILNDAYNANPGSMEAALKTARAMACPQGRAVAVLGHMAQLGRWSSREHRRIGARAAALAFDRLVLVGVEAWGIADGAARAGMPESRMAVCRDLDEAVACVSMSVQAGDIVLVKGSRVVGLERLASVLLSGAAERVTAAGVETGASRSAAPWP